VIAAWERFVGGEPVGDLVPPKILASWQRSRDTGVDPYRPSFRRASDLAQRLARDRVLVEAARPHLRWMSASFTIEHGVYLVDRDGIVLEAHGNSPELLARVQLVPGVDWSESQMGTNGAGTSLAIGEPIAVLGCQHYCRAWHDTTCCGSPVRSPDGEILGAIDLTTSHERGHREHLLAVRHVVYAIEHELGLRRAVSEERVSRVQAEDAVRRREELIAMVSHHFRSPLALIATSAAILERLLAAVAPGWTEAVLQTEQIAAAAQRMTSLVNNLLHAERLDAAIVTPAPADHELASLLADVAAAFAILARRRGQRVAVDAHPGLVVRCDRELTLQVLWNLLENALELSPDDSTIALRAWRDGACAHVCVIDHGPGIAPAALPRVFERHFQAQPRSRHGLGLGLFIARAFLEAQGGTIRVTSELGHGSEFCFELPLAEPAAG
jgi:signal transduction histidine kinase